ncbi:MAG TPA: fumarylacetoacetate hydrolase family protein [Trebonia sp.]|nr:fumarylacetoacetate hydrolase family protein [Trebonia sp.]
MATEQIRRELAGELWEAERSRQPVEPLTRRYPELDVADAYAIQSLNVSRHLSGGARIVGRKVGLTSVPMQRLLGVNEPDFGVLLDHMAVEDGDEVPLGRLQLPRIEAEVALIMERDLEGPGVTAARALTAIARAAPALEIVDSRVANWEIRLIDTVADNASSGMFVVGGNIRPLAGIDPRLIGVVVSRNGALADTGAGAAAFGNPVRCVAWLANKLATFGDGLHAGDIILPGAVHEMIPVAPGDSFQAEFAHLGTVTIRFSAQPPPPSPPPPRPHRPLGPPGYS